LFCSKASLALCILSLMVFNQAGFGIALVPGIAAGIKLLI
jgi:hypothetical protein